MVVESELKDDVLIIGKVIVHVFGQEEMEEFTGRYWPCWHARLKPTSKRKEVQSIDKPEGFHHVEAWLEELDESDIISLDVKLDDEYILIKEDQEQILKDVLEHEKQWERS